MIKNVVFDFGQVMVHFDPAYMVSLYVTDKEDARLLEAVVFDRLYWDKLDAGAISDREVIEKSKARLPEYLHRYVDDIYYSWIYNIPEIEGMRELVRYVKRSYGAHVFLLSNISEYFVDHADEIPVLEEFEKCIFSAACKKVKPSRDIFEHLCRECGIAPDETLFVDDNEKNIKGAEAFGIKGYLFDGDCEKLKRHLDTLLSCQ